ncbi:hypothetical protein QR680_018602 [Steinernema hermaphroditum]|uniref:Secreted protein n=1 Tax=Steinernema hermaphroditum TaxID=289476 RepID=A0AA39LR35_9BILA|nr:hypothetical protein QR680_018602 [Steinernema hermaphroditum]
MIGDLLICILVALITTAAVTCKKHGPRKVPDVVLTNYQSIGVQSTSNYQYIPPPDGAPPLVDGDNPMHQTCQELAPLRKEERSDRSGRFVSK